MAGIRGALLQPRVFAVVAISLFIALHLVMSEYSGFQLLLAPQAPAAAPTVVPTPMFSVVVPYYNQPLQLAAQLERYGGYSDAVRDVVEVIVVDDGSLKQPAELVFAEFNASNRLPDIALRVATINEDIGFNHGGACNTGAKLARGDYLLFLDVDHWIENDAFLRLIEFARQSWSPDKRFIYGFTKIDSTYEGRLAEVLEVLVRHAGGRTEKTFVETYMEGGSPNTIAVPRRFFWEDIGGYDEDFAGHYGHEDLALFRCAKRKFGVNQDTFRLRSHSIWAWYLGKGESNGFSRKLARNRKVYNDKGAQQQFCADPSTAVRVPFHISGSHQWQRWPELQQQ